MEDKHGGGKGKGGNEKKNKDKRDEWSGLKRRKIRKR